LSPNIIVYIIHIYNSNVTVGLIYMESKYYSIRNIFVIQQLWLWGCWVYFVYPSRW